jgi:hypothetical protein
LSKPTVPASAVNMLVENGVKLPAQVAEQLLLNPNDVESLCSLQAGALQRKRWCKFRFHQ